MAIWIDWAAKVINIPRADMPLVQASPEIRELDMAGLHYELRALEASVEGEPFPVTHNHIKPTSLSGTQFARSIEIINGYQIEFEDGQYAVNLTGGNNNILDVAVVNQVSIRSSNSAGLVVGSGSGTCATQPDLAITEKRIIEAMP